MKEIELKREVVKEIVAAGDFSLIASEFVFEFGRRRADLLCLSRGEVYGYEIKSASDNLDKLPDQIVSYMRLFDYVYVVCDESHLRRVREIVPGRVGIYSSRFDSFRRIRKAKKISKFDKVIMLDVLPKGRLSSLFGGGRLSKYDACVAAAIENSPMVIRAALIDYLGERYGRQTELFKREVSSVVTLDDMRTLFSPPPGSLDA